MKKDIYALSLRLHCAVSCMPLGNVDTVYSISLLHIYINAYLNIFDARKQRSYSVSEKIGDDHVCAHSQFLYGFDLHSISGSYDIL